MKSRSIEGRGRSVQVVGMGAFTVFESPFCGNSSVDEALISTRLLETSKTGFITFGDRLAQLLYKCAVSKPLVNLPAVSATALPFQPRRLPAANIHYSNRPSVWRHNPDRSAISVRYNLAIDHQETHKI